MYFFFIVSTLDYHTLLSYNFHIPAQSYQDKWTVVKPASSTLVSDTSVLKLIASLNHFLICRFRVFKHIISTEKRYLKLSFEFKLHVGLFTVLINLCKPVNSLQMLKNSEGSKNRTHSLPSCCLFTLVVREATPMKQTMILCLDFWSNGTRRFST